MEETNQDFFLNIVYKNKTVKFRVVNPDAPLSVLMTNLRLPSLPIAWRRFVIKTLSGASGLTTRNFTVLFL